MSSSIGLHVHPALQATPEAPRLRVVAQQEPPDRQLALPLRSVTTAETEVDPALTDRASGFVQALVEIVEGRRPVLQLAPWVSDAVYEQVLDRRSIRLRGQRGLGRSRVVSVHVSSPVSDAAEVAARLDTGRRSRALALRLDRRPDCRGRLRWKCTALAWG